jgi:ppGpp synthetase/RelA/SpoT-type nucleotidyltranferase
VAEFPPFTYTTKDVRKAGEALAQKLIWTDETAEDIRRVFAIAHNWRDTHAYPMRRFREILAKQIKKHQAKASAVARLKRMPSIRRKLHDQQWPLDKIQDLAGCRAIVPSINDANAVVEGLRQVPRHILHREDPYIEKPKANGYRCHHMVYRYRGNGDDSVFDERRIEIQIRTWLQHSWATAVEAVGAYRSENMKAGEGNPEWLRLFALMSGEFALAEKCPEPPGLPERSERVREIGELEQQLDAVSSLENIAHVVKYTEHLDPKSKPEYYQIIYDRKSRIVNVEPYFNVIAGARAYDKAEVDADKSQSGITTVLVEADGIEILKAAYPNYFGDVEKFCIQLKSITQGDKAVEFAMLPRTTPPLRKKPSEKPDYGWIGRSPFHKPYRRRR